MFGDRIFLEYFLKKKQLIFIDQLAAILKRKLNSQIKGVPKGGSWLNGVNLLASISRGKNQGTPTSPGASSTGSVPASAGDLNKSATVDSSSEINFERDGGISENLEGHTTEFSMPVTVPFSKLPETWKAYNTCAPPELYDTNNIDGIERLDGAIASEIDPISKPSHAFQTG